MTDLADAEARRRILTEFGTTFFVEAAAGTGKTTRPGRPDRRAGPHWRRHARPDCGGHLHREGGW